MRNEGISPSPKALPGQSAGATGERGACARLPRTPAAHACRESSRRIQGLRAFTFRPIYPDFEDDMVVTSALSANVDFLVSNDESMLRHAPIKRIGAEAREDL